MQKIEKKYAVDFSKLKPREWCFEGKLFSSPNWKQNGKPYQINKQIKLQYIDQLKPIPEPQKPKVKSGLVLRILEHFASKPITSHTKAKIQPTEDENEFEEEEEDWNEFLTTEEEWE